MAQKVCVDCLDHANRCPNKCDVRFCFSKVSDFVDWMVDPSNSHFIFIAHNAKGYDSYMIINELQKRKTTTDAKIETNVNGTKVMYMKFRDI